MTEQQQTTPTVSIYQNADHVEGILQQVFQRPLLTDWSDETAQRQGSSGDRTTSVTGEGKGQGRVPGVGSIEAGIGADYQHRIGDEKQSGWTGTSNWRYTQAYYLYAARDGLRSQGLLKKLAGRGDAEAARPGQFVEFTAKFDANQLLALLDIVTADLIRAILRKVTHDERMSEFKGGDLEAAQVFKLRMDSDVEAAGEIAHAIAGALGADFRSDKTREFYARIGEDEDQVTAITMCDAAHFTIDDEDRILDGVFTVLGKVVSPVVENEPILSRNKVLSRFKADAVDQLLASFNQDTLASMEKQVVERFESGTADESGCGEADDIGFDFEVDSRVAGPSLRVIPVAIYI